ncbi:MAG TPA: AbrB/MazE/SpoVT family DNA-binding domain-containing protein [Kiritimatiellia bacterium]|jgi:AbrB family looped-hinge helix DNA binding protein|nr:AbrB/MazE/SpoVT family DNA-binding domain-containing protein [Kiritimatiellia bacterium]NCC92070.1 AbrB family transcriptional regulator [Opitutae bacterium]HPC58239.1 AbrB/MazE/SpoVT family DNA-binding domain-containing protein [Kiritimatiellia bacterium]
MTGTLTSKGQVTVPVEIRRFLNVGPGDKLLFARTGSRVEIVPATTSVRQLKTVLPKPARRLTLAQMEAAVRRGAGA